MYANAQVLPDDATAFRTFLGGAPSVNFRKELASLPTHILDDGSELTERGVDHVFTKHPLSADPVVQILHENHVASVAQGMRLLVMKVLSRVVDLVVQSRHFDALPLVIVRPLLFPRQSALQQFQLALQLFKKLRRFYENTITGCQKLLQPDINSNGASMWGLIGNANITLQGDRCVPLVSFPQDSYLLDHESSRDRSMQVNWDCPNLGQFKVQVCCWVFLELRKQQRFELPELLESGETKSFFLKVFPSSVQLFNGLLENLRRDFTQFWKFLLSFGQVVKLLNFVRKLQLRRKDVLFLKGTSIYQTLTAITPIFYLSKRVVICSSTDFHPLNELVFLSGAGIDSIAVRQCQHPSIIQYLLETSNTLNVKREGIEPSLLTAFHPPLNFRGYLAAPRYIPLSYSGGLPGELDKCDHRTRRVQG